MVRIYCKNCKHFQYFLSNCDATKNIEWRDNYYEIYKEYINLPKFINENNDCNWYQDKQQWTVINFFKNIFERIGWK